MRLAFAAAVLTLLSTGAAAEPLSRDVANLEYQACLADQGLLGTMRQVAQGNADLVAIGLAERRIHFAAAYVSWLSELSQGRAKPPIKNAKTDVQFQSYCGCGTEHLKANLSHQRYLTINGELVRAAIEANRRNEGPEQFAKLPISKEVEEIALKAWGACGAVAPRS